MTRMNRETIISVFSGESQNLTLLEKVLAERQRTAPKGEAEVGAGRLFKTKAYLPFLRWSLGQGRGDSKSSARDVLFLSSRDFPLPVCLS